VKFHLIYIIQFLLILVSKGTSLIAQEWTEPVQVSDNEGAFFDPDMCIDNNGNIHVVWSSGTFGSNNWQILYSKSENDGEIWSADIDISQNDTLWMSQPHIENDSENNLYVTYDYNTIQPSLMHVLLRIYNGQLWSDSILITEGMPGSDYNKIVIDNNDNVFIGWYRNSKFYYRFYENGLLSQIYCPYCDSIDKFLPVVHALTSNGIVKWVGSSSSINYSGERLQYFEHNLLTNSWSQPELLDTNILKVGLGIDVDGFDNAGVSYRIQTSVWPNPFSDATLFKYNNGQEWSEAELIVDDPEDQQIVWDQYDYPHVINREKTNTGSQIVHYRKISNDWIGTIIDSTPNFCNPTKLIFKNNQLYLVYFRNFTPGYPDCQIMFTKYAVTTNINENKIPIEGLHVFPNPARYHTTINFEINDPGEVQLRISDFSGRLIKTLLKSKLQKGVYKIDWDGTNELSNPVKCGFYLCRLYCSRNVITKSIEIIR
jgi:hypothetical protein